uniref:Uncharacterized protein n=1 Tax=Neospora caninum (strain Liverpool) TaxID=572307 RepID=A0A0F7UJJ3_NEOCL|nr:TPA: hypothetical protein BN1204_040530 [Neospora caninum Liverpool]
MRHPHVASFPASVIGRRNHEVRGAFLTCCSIWSLSPPFIFACVAILWLPSSSYAHAHLGVISLTNKSFLNRNGPFGFRAFAHNDTFISADDTTHPDSVPSGSSYGLTVAHNIKFSGVPVTHDAFFLYVPSKHGTPRTAAVNAFESSAEEGEDAAVKAAALAAADLSWGSCSAFCDGGRQQWNRTLAMNEAMAGIRTVATKADEAELKGVVVAALEGKYGRDEWRQCHAFPCGALADQAKLDMVAAKTGAAPLLGRNLAAAMVDGDCGVYVELELDEACREKLLLLEITTDTWELLLGMNNHAGLFGAPPIRGAPQNDGLRSGSKREPASAGTPQDTAAGVDASTVTAESRPSVRATAEGLDSDDAGATLQLDQLMSGLSFSSCLTLCQFRDDCAAIIYKGDPAELARVKDHSEGVETIRNASHAERTSDVRQPQRHSAVSVCQLIKSMSLPLCFKPVMSEPVLSSSASFLSHLPVPSILVVKGAALTLCSPVLEDQISRVKSQVDQLEKQWKGTKEQSMNREREAREEAANQTPLAAARFRLLALESMRKLLQIRVSDGGPVEAGKQEEGEVVSQGGGRVVAREALWGTKSLLPLSTNSVDTDVWRSQVALPLSPACPAFQWVRLYAGAGCAMPLLVREVSLGAERNGSWQASQQVVSRRRGLRKLPHGALELHRGAQGLLPKNEETTTKQARLKPIETVSNNSPSPSGDPKSQFDRTGEKATTLALLQMKRTETNAEHSMMPAADDTKQARAAGVSSRETRNGDAEKGGPVMPRATRATDASPEGKLASSSFSPLILSPLDMAPKHHEDGIRGALTAVRPTKSRTRQKEVLPFRQADHSDDNGASTTRSSEGAPDTDNTGSVRKESKPSGAHSSPPGVDFMGTPQLNVTDTTPPASESDLKGWRECYALLMRLVARQQMLKAVPVPEEQGVAGNYWLSEEDSDIQDVLDRVSAFSVSTKPEEVAEAKRLRGIIRAYRQGEAALFASYDLVRENCSVYALDVPIPSSISTSAPISSLFPTSCVVYAPNFLLLLPPTLDAAADPTLLRRGEGTTEASEAPNRSTEEMELLRSLPPYTCPTSCALTGWSSWSTCESARQYPSSVSLPHTQDQPVSAGAKWSVRVRGVTRVPFPHDACPSHVQVKLCEASEDDEIEGAVFDTKNWEQPTSLRVAEETNVKPGGTEKHKPQTVKEQNTAAAFQSQFDFDKSRSIDQQMVWARALISRMPQRASRDCVLSPFSPWSECLCPEDEIRDRMQSKDTANERHRGFSQVLADSRGTASSDSARALSQRALRATEVKAKTKRIMGARKRSRHVLQAEIPCIGVACQEVHLEETETCDATTQCHAQVLEARDQQAQQARTAKERLDIFSEQTPPRSQTTEQQVASSSSEAADLSVEEKGRKAADGLGLADPEHKPVDGANGTFNQTAGGEANNLSPQWGDASTPSLDDITKNDLYDITDTGLRQGDGGQAVNVTFTVRPKRRSPIIKSSSHKDQETRLDVIRDAATKSALPKTQEAVHPSPSPPTLLSASQLQLGNEKLIREHYLPELGPVSNPGGASPRQTYASAAQPSTGPLNADDVELPTGENISYLNFILMTITGSLSALTCIFFCIACNKKVRLMLAVGEGALPRQEEMLEQVHRRQRGRPVPAAYPQSDASVNTSRVTSSDEKYVVDANNQPLMATACFSAGASGSTPAGTQLRTSSDSKICNAQDERLVGDWGKDLGVENLPVQRRPNCARGPWHRPDVIGDSSVPEQPIEDWNAFFETPPNSSRESHPSSSRRLATGRVTSSPRRHMAGVRSKPDEKRESQHMREPVPGKNNEVQHRRIRSPHEAGGGENGPPDKKEEGRWHSSVRSRARASVNGEGDQADQRISNKSRRGNSASGDAHSRRHDTDLGSNKNSSERNKEGGNQPHSSSRRGSRASRSNRNDESKDAVNRNSKTDGSNDRRSVASPVGRAHDRESIDRDQRA